MKRKNVFVAWLLAGLIASSGFTVPAGAVESDEFIEVQAEEILTYIPYVHTGSFSATETPVEEQSAQNTWFTEFSENILPIENEIAPFQAYHVTYSPRFRVRHLYTEAQWGVSPGRLERFLEVLEHLFDSGVQLTGRVPPRLTNGRLTINTDYGVGFAAHVGGPNIYLAEPFFGGYMRDFDNYNRVDLVVLHELGHSFTVDNRMYGCVEQIANWIANYLARQLPDVYVRCSNIHYPGPEFAEWMLWDNLQWAYYRSPDPSNLLWRIYAPVVEAHGWEPFYQTFRNFAPGGAYAYFTPRPWISDPSNTYWTHHLAGRTHRLMEVLDHFTPGGLASVVSPVALQRFQDQ